VRELGYSWRAPAKAFEDAALWLREQAGRNQRSLVNPPRACKAGAPRARFVKSTPTGVLSLFLDGDPLRAFHLGGVARTRVRCRQFAIGPAAFTSSAMPEPSELPAARAATPPWDARLARALVRPLRCSPITPNHLTTVRLAFGIAAAGAFMRGGYAWMNLGAVLLAVSNFLDHTDGELARISGKTSRVGHWYDLASDAVVTILLFTAIGVGVGTRSARVLQVPPLALGTIAGIAIVLIFFLRAHIEEMAGRAASKQASMGGFETEDVLYLLPLVTLCNGVTPFLVAAAIGAPLFAVWVVFDYRRVRRGYTR